MRWIDRLFGYLMNLFLVLMSRISFTVTLREGLSIPALPVIYASFYHNLVRILGPESGLKRFRAYTSSLAFSLLYQAESAFINLMLIKIGPAIRLLSFLFRRGYLCVFDRPDVAEARLYLFHNYIGARTGILFFLIRSIVRGENNVLFADPQVFRLVKIFKRSLRAADDTADTEGKVVFGNRYFPMGGKEEGLSGEQVILNTASQWNLISAVKYMKKGYRFLIIPESRTEEGHREKIGFIGRGLWIPDGARWLASRTGSAISVLVARRLLFIPAGDGFRFKPVPESDFHMVFRMQEKRVLDKPFLYMPFLHSLMWEGDDDKGKPPRILVKMKWKRKKLLFYSGGKVGIVGEKANVSV